MSPNARLPAAVVLILTALAAAALPAPVAAAEGTAVLTVHVTGAGGLPLAGATVAVTSAEAEAIEATTDASGNASFDLAPGNYTVTVSATGHETATEHVPFGSKNDTLEVALDATGVEPVARGDVVVDVVSASNGTAIAGARVTIVFSDRDEKATMRTDRDGRAVFEDLLYGRGEVIASRSGHDDASSKFTLASSEERVLLKLEPDAAEGDASIDVVVRDDRGDPIAGADVQGNTWNEHTSGFDSARTDERGRATITLPAGHGGVSVSHPDYYGGYASFDATDGDADVEVVMTEKPKPDATLAGVVVDEDGDAIENAHLWISVDYRWYEKRMAAGDRSMAPYYCCPDTVEATTDEDGAFEVRVHSGDLNIQTTAKGYASQTDRAHVDSGDTEEVRITLLTPPPRDAVLRGRVFDASTGEPVANAGVNLNNFAWSDYGYAQTDAQGRFEITTYPGYVQVNVWPNYGPVCIAAEAAVDDGDDTAASDGNSTTNETSASYAADSMIYPSPCVSTEPSSPPKQYYTFVTQLVLRSGSNELDARLDPKPEPKTELVGYVLSDGEGVAGAWVSVRNEDTGEWGNAQTDEHGSYKIMVRPGRLVVDASADGHFQRSDSLRVSEEGRVRHDMELVAGTPRWIPCDECHYDGGYGYSRGGMVAEDAAYKGYDEHASAPSVTLTMESGASEGFGNALSSAGPKTGSGANSFVGGGGGLGPYTASSAAGGDNKTPGLGLVAVVAAGALVALVARRR